MMRINRMIVIVLDGVGAGEAPDAAAYGERITDKEWQSVCLSNLQGC